METPNRDEGVMDRDIVVVVPTEAAAYLALRRLRQLDDDGAIELYAAAVISKDANGRVTVDDKENGRVGWGTLLGMSTGALIGLLAGPVGAAAGLAIGGGTGLVVDGATPALLETSSRERASNSSRGGARSSRTRSRTGRCRWTPRWR
jgi:hypothetical protein